MLNILVSIINLAGAFLLMVAFAIVVFLFIKAIPLMILRIDEEIKELKKPKE